MMTCLSCGRELPSYRTVRYCDHFCQHPDWYPEDMVQRRQECESQKARFVEPVAPVVLAFAVMPSVDAEVAVSVADEGFAVDAQVGDTESLTVELDEIVVDGTIAADGSDVVIVDTPPLIFVESVVIVESKDSSRRVKAPRQGNKTATPNYTGQGHSPKVPGYVYVMYSPNRVMYKIGLSVDVRSRSKQLRSEIGDSDLRVLFFIKVPSMLEMERRLHCSFASKRVDGEWFRLSKADVASIKSIGVPYYPDW